jgi:fatty acid desaturase
LDSKTFLSTLDSATRLQLTARHPWAGYAHLAGHVGAILVTGTLIAFQVPFWGLLLPVHGILMVFVFTLGHECTHRTPFASDRACDLAGHATGLVLILPFHWFRAFHLSHHRHTNVPGQDPELEGGKPETLRAWVWHVSGIPIWISQIRTVVLLAFGRFEARYISERTRQKMEGEARILLVLYTCAAISLVVSPVLLWVWIVPLILGQPFLRLYLLAEHGDCPFVENMFLNTRTTFTTRLTRFIAWNMPYHAEHHTYPMVPFHNLPALHKQMKAHLGVTSDGYTDFTRCYLARRRSV